MVLITRSICFMMMMSIIFNTFYMPVFAQGVPVRLKDVGKIIKAATDILNRENGKNPYIVHEKLQDIMQTFVSIVRTGEELEAGLNKLQELKADIKKVSTSASAQYNPGWNEALDLNNLIITAEAVTRAALIRQESRGAHTRLDFAGEQEEGLEYNIVIKRTDLGMSAEKVKREDPPKELADIGFASLAELEGGNIGA